MSFAMNPTQVKRREYLGLAALTIGLVAAIAGIISLLFLLPLGLSLIVVGTALFASGIFILMKIPDIVGPPEELWSQ